MIGAFLSGLGSTAMSGLGKVGSLFGGGGSGDMLSGIGGALFGGGNRAVKRMGQGYIDAERKAMPHLQRASGRYDPYAAVGSEATGLISSLLGLGGTPAKADYGAYLEGNDDVAQYYRDNPKALERFGGDMDAAAKFHYDTFGKGEGRELPMSGGTSDTAGAEGLARFRESTGYQDTLNSALGGVTSSAAARGLMGSSGTGKMFQKTAADLAQGSFSDFLNRLVGQQSVGMEATGAQAGIDADMANLLYKNTLGHAGTMAKKRGGGFLGSLFGAMQDQAAAKQKEG